MSREEDFPARFVYTSPMNAPSDAERIATLQRLLREEIQSRTALEARLKPLEDAARAFRECLAEYLENCPECRAVRTRGLVYAGDHPWCSWCRRFRQALAEHQPPGSG